MHREARGLLAAERIRGMRERRRMFAVAATIVTAGVERVPVGVLAPGFAC